MHRLAPGRAITVTDYAPGTVARLQELVPELHAAQHDLLRDAPLAADVHLFHRIDAEFRSREWRQILDRFRDERVLIAPNEPTTWRTVVLEARRALRPRRTARAGWFRNTAAQRALWRHAHALTPVSLGDREGWLLEPR